MESLPVGVCARIAAHSGPAGTAALACASRACHQLFTGEPSIVALLQTAFSWQPLTPTPSYLLRVLCAIEGSYVSEEHDQEQRYHSMMLADGRYLWLTRTAPAASARSEVVGAQEGRYVCVISPEGSVRLELRGDAGERSVVRVVRLQSDGHSSLQVANIVLHEEDRAGRSEFYISNEADVNAPLAERRRHERKRRYWLEETRVSAERAMPRPVNLHPSTRAASLSAEKRTLYALMIAQLQSEGLASVARALQDATNVSTSSLTLPLPLAQLVLIALSFDANANANTSRTSATSSASTLASSSLLATSVLRSAGPSAARGTAHSDRTQSLDLDDVSTSAHTRASPQYGTRFVTTHKSSVRCARFSPDGRYVATGSTDTSVKLLDAARMATFANSKDSADNDGARSERSDRGDRGASRPVLRTFYDHTGPVNDLAFHPFVPILASGSRDATVRLFEFTGPAKHAWKSVPDTHPVRSLAFHPCGDFLLVATEHFMIRLYDVNTTQAFVTAQAEEHHHSAVTQVRYSPDGKYYASAGKDGAVKIWDATSSRVVRTLTEAHTGMSVSSVQITRNGKYLLTGGLDSVCRLWDVSSGKQVRAYMGATQTKNRVQTSFTVDEEFVVSSDETSNSALLWDTRTGDLLQRLPGHTALVRAVATSDTDAALITCSDDHRARFWTSEALHQSLLSA